MAAGVEAPKNEASRKVAGAVNDRYLAFRLEEENYGIDILRVQEILQLISITRVPRVPEYVTGVINLRGHVIPILDLKKLFGMSRSEYTRKSCIIVVNVQGHSEKLVMGALVDEVFEVMRIPSADIQPPPSLGAGKLDTSYISGMGKVDSRVITLMDIERVLAGASQEMLNGQGKVKTPA